MRTAVGRWVLIDALNQDQYGLLSVGDENFSGASARKTLDPLSRELLMDRVRRAIESRQPVEESVYVRGDGWDVYVEPILAPTNRIPIGARAVYVPIGESKPSPPPVGAVEWKIMDGGARIETVWNDDMFKLYGVTRSGTGSATGDMSQWIASLIAPEDRARMKVVIDGGIAAPDGQRHMVAYRIVTGKGSDNEGVRLLEASGRIFEENSQLKWLRSITREVGELEAPAIPLNVDVRSAGLLRASFELAPPDTALIAVDAQYWQIFMTSPSWHAMKMRTPTYGYLPHVIHPDDLDAFLARCQKGSSEAPVPIRFLRTDGAYCKFTVTASDGHFGGGENQRYIIASLRAEDPGYCLN